MSTIRRRSSSEANSTVILPLRWPRSTLTRVSSRSESRSARSWSPGAVGLRRRTGVSSDAGLADRDDLLEPAHADALGDDPRGQPVLAGRGPRRRAASGRGRPRARRRRPGAGRPVSSLSSRMRVADLRAGPADPRGQLVVGAGEVLEQLLVRRRLLQRVELRPVQVLQQRVAQHVGVVGLPHDRRDRVQARLLGRAPAALAHDQLVGRRRRCAARPPAAAARPPGWSGPARPSPPPRRPGAAARGLGRDLVDRQVGEVGAGRRRRDGRPPSDRRGRAVRVLLAGAARRSGSASPGRGRGRGAASLRHGSSLLIAGRTLRRDLAGRLEVGQRAR